MILLTSGVLNPTQLAEKPSPPCSRSFSPSGYENPATEGGDSREHVENGFLLAVENRDSIHNQRNKGTAVEPQQYWMAEVKVERDRK